MVYYRREVDKMGNSSKGSKVVKWVLIGVSFLFIAIMLILTAIPVASSVKTIASTVYLSVTAW